VEETAEALEGFAVASWWQDDVDEAIKARERAYALRRERGETLEAARVAGFLAWDYGAVRGTSAVANGWLQRARRLVEDLEPSAEHAWLPLIEASFHLDTDAEAVLRLASEALEHAKAHGGLDIEMTARTLQGLALVSLGRVGEGTRLLDEGTAAATAGELYDPIAIGSCCCNMIRWQGDDRTVALGLPDERPDRSERSSGTEVGDETAPAIVGVRPRPAIVVVPAPGAMDPEQPAASARVPSSVI
jgi:LuxR family maltose regulon positive regulatory protein